VLVFLFFFFPNPPGYLRVVTDFGALDKVASHDPALAADLRERLNAAITSMRFLSHVALACIALGIWSLAAALFSLGKREDFPPSK
jgi:hypothetical protein